RLSARIASYSFDMSPRFAGEIVDTATFLWGVLGLAGLPAAGLFVVMFDAPGSHPLSTYSLAASVMRFPLAFLLFVFMAWRALRAGATSSACAWLTLPLANVVIFGAAATWIEMFQDGRFNG